MKHRPNTETLLLIDVIDGQLNLRANEQSITVRSVDQGSQDIIIILDA